MFWMVPAVVAGVGLLVAVVMGFKAGEELGALRRQVRHLAELRPALVEVGDTARTLGATLRKPKRP